MAAVLRRCCCAPLDVVAERRVRVALQALLHTAAGGYCSERWREAPLHPRHDGDFFVAPVVHGPQIIDEHFWIHGGWRRPQPHVLGDVAHERSAAVQERVPYRRTGLKLLDVGDDSVVLGLAEYDPISSGDVLLFQIAVARPVLSGDGDPMSEHVRHHAVACRMNSSDVRIHHATVHIEASIHGVSVPVAQCGARAKLDEIARSWFNRRRAAGGLSYSIHRRSGCVRFGVDRGDRGTLRGGRWGMTPRQDAKCAQPRRQDATAPSLWTVLHRQHQPTADRGSIFAPCGTPDLPKGEPFASAEKQHSIEKVFQPNVGRPEKRTQNLLKEGIFSFAALTAAVRRLPTGASVPGG